MTRDEEIKQAAFERNCDGDFDSNDGLIGFIEGANWADAHPTNPWRDASKELPKIEDEDWQCSCECLVRVKDSRFYEVAVYFPKSRVWCRYDDYEIVVRNVSYWMPIPKLPE